MQRLIGWIAAAGVLVGICCGAARAEERWYVVLLQGQKTGWMMERSEVEETGRLRNTSELVLKIGRGATAVEMKMRSVSLEEADGTPVRTESDTQQGLTNVSRKFDFTKTKVIERVTQGGRLTTNTHELPRGDWMMPGAAARETRRLLDAGETEFVISMLDTSMGLQVVDVTTRVKGETVVEAFGKTVPAVEHEVLQSILPGIVTREFVGLDGEMVRSTLSLGPGMELTILAADEATAKSNFDAPELMASTLVKPDKPIKDARWSSRATYILRVSKGKMPELPSEGRQHVKVLDEQSVEVSYHQYPERLFPGFTEDSYLAATSAADSNDPEIVKLVEKATDGIDKMNKHARAAAMRTYVNLHITGKDLSVGFATASEVCRTGEGDCTEHAVLLAAMLRADGIPSRVVSGLIYVDNFLGEEGVFGYHMWTQVYLVRRTQAEGGWAWYDFDATLPGNRWTDATHIALSTSDLSDSGTMNTMVSLANVLGSLEIEVVEVQ
jgi:hypothetical protein